MKTLFCTLVIITASLACKAQVYTIPWAQAQPAWVFPLWFENGDGQKDTIYIAYDPNGISAAPSVSQNSDTIFGEVCRPQLLSNFFVYFNGVIDAQCNQGGVVKSQVMQFDYSEDSIIYCPISVIHHVYPLKIKWDLNVFRSIALPFNTCSNCPKALGLMYVDYWYSGPVNVQCLSIGYEIAFTDSSLETCNLVRDSLVLNQVVFPETIGLQYIKIKKWRADSLFLSSEEIEKNNLVVYPNPFQDYLIIEGSNSISQVRIIDVLGNVIYENKFNGNNVRDKKIDGLNKLISGAYILQHININETINKLIIKN